MRRIISTLRSYGGNRLILAGATGAMLCSERREVDVCRGRKIRQAGRSGVAASMTGLDHLRIGGSAIAGPGYRLRRPRWAGPG
jgi:hypothetical protein